MVARDAEIDLATAELAVGSTCAAPLSLDRSTGEVEGDFSLQDLVADDTSEQAFTQAEAETLLGPLLASLDRRQRQILQLCASAKTGPATTSSLVPAHSSRLGR
jgi:DNA-directed RNA polymerase sigma subunit (sigma70/sigma32)